MSATMAEAEAEAVGGIAILGFRGGGELRRGLIASRVFSAELQREVGGD